MAVGIVTGLMVEARCLDCHGRPVRIRSAGGDLARAEALARDLAARHASGLISFGVAGGLVPGLRAGTLMIPGWVAGPDGARWHSEEMWRHAVLGACRVRGWPVDGGLLVSTEAVCASVNGKRALARATGARAVDIETAGVARAAAAAGIPFLAVRAIADPHDCPIPTAILARFEPSGELSILRLIAALALRPAELAGMVRLSRNGQAALAALRRVGKLDTLFEPPS